eukprot:Gregarina_sp_Poly_1__9115@NODE_559_length_7530_cov_48_357899_g440_i0_p3_GENE_NODE_559_length_7530_cov_48_357899_g440_i0NODE_559_length_7530_cov_48_357899_g440_i0_p3_ORF_typecomplete_len374_score38_35Adap_comp_sub/PF00928_21/9_8e36_NODE_559_length_7530_cov_48_357899_g440_i064097437
MLKPASSAGQGPKTVPSNASQTPISASISSGTVSGTSSHDIFIDIIDRVSLDATVDGQIKSLSVDGMVLIKSYLANPTELRLGLNEDLVITNEFFQTSGQKSTDSLCQMEDCLFHESVVLDDFANTKSLVFVPPQGEFVFMRYRVAPSLIQRPPFLIYADVSILDKDRISISVRLRAENYQKSYCGVAAMTLDLPRWISNCQTQIIGQPQNQLCDFVRSEFKVNWTNRRISMAAGDCGFIAKADVDLDRAPRLVRQALLLGSSTAAGTGEISAFPRGLSPKGIIGQYLGPVLLNFELPMFSSSKLQIRYLRLAAGNSAGVTPRRWVRYATQSASFTARFVSN